MRVYTYSEARQKPAMAPKEAESSRKIIIRRKDGRAFALMPERDAVSPLDVPSIKAKVATQKIVDMVREAKER